MISDLTANAHNVKILGAESKNQALSTFLSTIYGELHRILSLWSLKLWLHPLGRSETTF